MYLYNHEIIHLGFIISIIFIVFDIIYMHVEWIAANIRISPTVTKYGAR